VVSEALKVNGTEKAETTLTVLVKTADMVAGLLTESGEADTE